MTAEEPFACPKGEALWEIYRERHPNGLTSPPVGAEDVADPPPELAEYLDHYATCDDCNEI